MTSPDPGLTPDLDDPALPTVTGQGVPTPPVLAKGIREAAALLDQARQESYDARGDDPVDGTRDPYRG